MPTDALSAAIRVAHNAPYNYDAKEDWLRKGKAVLRRLAKDLDLPKGTYEIRVCKGGIAVAGDVILHHDRLYVNLSSFFQSDAGYARTCKGRKDYTGGQNHPVPRSYDGLLRLCRGLLGQVAA